MGDRVRHLLLTVLAAWAGSCPARAQEPPPGFVEQVFLTEEGALKSVFPEADRFEKAVRVFSPDEKKRIEGRLGWVLSESSVTVHRGFRGNDFLGWALVLEEIGKFKPITFMVRINPDGKVGRVEIMVYREAVGSEVRRQRFLRQFRNKRAADPLRINRDILNVTGATMSVQAVTAGVKKAVALVDELFLHPRRWEPPPR